METLPAKDDDALRHLNSKKVADGVESIGKHYEEMRKWNKLLLSISAITGILMLVLLVVIFYASYSIKGSSFIDTFSDRDLLASRYKCCESDNCITFRQPTQAKDFKLLFPDSKCTFWDVRSNAN